MAQGQNKQKAQAFGVTQALCAITAEQYSLRSVNGTQWQLLSAMWGDAKCNRAKLNRDLLNFHQRLQAVEAKLVNTESKKARRLIRRRVFIHVRTSHQSSGKAVEGACCACTALTKTVTAGAGTHATSPPTAATPSPVSSTTTLQPVPTEIAAAAEPELGLINHGSAAAAASSTATSPSDKQTATATQPPSPLQPNARSRIPVPDRAKSSPLPNRVQCSVKPSPRSVKATPNCRTTPTSSSTPSRLPKLARTPTAKFTPATPIKRTEAVEPVDPISRASAASVPSSVTSLSSRPAMPLTATSHQPSVNANQAAEGVLDLISQPLAAAGPSTGPMKSVLSEDALCFKSWCREVASVVPLPPADKEEEEFFAASDALQQPTATQAHPESNEPKGKATEPKMSEEEEREKLLKIVQYIRNKLNTAFDPAGMFRIIQRSLHKVGRSIESLEAEYQALQLSGYRHAVYIPDVRPDVVEILEEEEILERDL
ncbi:hypothetical protein HDU80_009571 [Chytriomyces hyalinus]|nr:hypothetical protein HDU80_009571 [Chytriomyces hyalinus]